jgi:hypothetical protein
LIAGPSIRSTVTRYGPVLDGGKIAMTASLRDDPLGKLYARRQIDDAQYRLAKDWAYLNRKAPALLPSIGFKIVVRSLLREARERRQVALWLER